MTILAIDPGPKESAFCVWDGEKIIGKNIVPTEEIENAIRNNPDAFIACEHLQCFGMSVGKEVFQTAYWIGEFRGLCKSKVLIFIPVYRSEVKMFFCNSMRAKDSNIRTALIDRFGPPGTKHAQGLTYGLKKDLWSAFAIAVMVFDKTKGVIEHDKSS